MLLDPPWAWLRGKERDEGRLLSCKALGQVSVSRRYQDMRHILKGIGTLAIPEDVRRVQAKCPETKWIHVLWATLRTWWSVQ